jgi:large subunit ribosomal protein L47
MNFAKNFIVNAQKSASLVSRQNGVFVQSARTMFSSTKVSRGLDEMFTGYNAASTGRSWSAAELRMKSPEDLEKLHYVCLKELNMLRTYQHFIRKTPGIVMSHPERIPKVRKTMALIRHVVGERRLIFKRSSTYHYHHFYLACMQF